jgi:hypothetical protein
MELTNQKKCKALKKALLDATELMVLVQGKVIEMTGLVLSINDTLLEHAAEDQASQDALAEIRRDVQIFRGRVRFLLKKLNGITESFIAGMQQGDEQALVRCIRDMLVFYEVRKDFDNSLEAAGDRWNAAEDAIMSRLRG